MRILAIESSTVTASCAVSERSRILGEISLNHKKTHSEKLMPLIEKLMAELELTMKDIDVVAISEGPGSYTGLRIGAAIAKSLAYAADLPVAGIPTIKSLAGNILTLDKLIVPVMDAKAGRIYTGIYKWQDGNLTDVAEQFPCNINELIDMLNKFDEQIIFNGDGSVNYRKIIEENLNKKPYFAPDIFNDLRASTLAYLAYNKALKGELTSASDFKPIYLRLSQAERNKK